MSSLTTFTEDPFFKTAGYGNRDVTPFRSMGDSRVVDPFSMMTSMTPWGGGGGGNMMNMMTPFGLVGGDMMGFPREAAMDLNRAGRQMEKFTPILRCDIVEREKDFCCHVELPGVKPTDVDVEVRDNCLYIKGHKETSTESGSPDDTYWHRERTTGRVERTIPIPENANSLECEVTLNHGMLQVTFPKLASTTGQSRRRKLEIKSGHSADEKHATKKR